MKSLIVSFFAMLICNLSISQNLLLNGSFESNTAIGNTLGLSTNWADTVSDSWGIDAGIMSLITSNSCGTASDGNWYVTNCAGCSIAASYLSFSLKLSTPLVAGNQYTVEFDKKYCGNSTAIEIGTTTDSTLAGITIHTFTGATTSAWVQESFVFPAPLSADYITVSVNLMPSDLGFVALDNFKIFAGTVAVDEPPRSQSFLNIYPNPAKDKITISSNILLNDAQLEIYNVYGEKIFQERKTIAMNRETDIENIPSGIYFVRIFDSQKSFLQKLIVE